MEPRATIAAVRDRVPLARSDLDTFARGLASGAVSDAQAGAFAMAVLLNGLPPQSRVDLTLAMRDSGRVLDWDLPGPVVDKHSTGGIGDATSLLLAPALATLGCFVPMISGRGLGHTGGTLDKLEAIPGLRTDVSEDRFRAIVRDVGCAIVSATDEIAPADRRLYAIRDVTSTVESLDLITASILSKKLAAGLEALVLDVKTGSGAFMKTIEAAEDLARSLVDTATGAGCRASALITDMNQPLAHAAGNALEVQEVMLALADSDTDTALCDLTADLGGEILVLSGLAEDRREGAALVIEAIRSGRAAEAFGRMVRALGGPADFVERWRDRLPSAPVVVDLAAPRGGYLARMDGFALGEAVVHLGGGRLDVGDRIDPAVGLSDILSLGDEVDRGDTILRIHARTRPEADAAAERILYGIGIDDAPPDLPPVTYRSVTA